MFTPNYRKKLLFGSGGTSALYSANLPSVERKLHNFLGHKFWARGYFVSTVGRDEETIRTYIKNQEVADKQFVLIKSRLLSQNPL